VVLDLVMPGAVAGVSLIRELRARSPELGIVVVTGLGSGREREAARELGVLHFLIKPVESGDLARAVREAVERVDVTEAHT